MTIKYQTLKLRISQAEIDTLHGEHNVSELVRQMITDYGLRSYWCLQTDDDPLSGVKHRHLCHAQLAAGIEAQRVDDVVGVYRFDMQGQMLASVQINQRGEIVERGAV